MSHYFCSCAAFGVFGVLALAEGCGGRAAGAPAVQAAPQLAAPGATAGPASSALASSALASSAPTRAPLTGGVTVTVQNPLAVARGSETIVVALAEVQKLLPSLQANQTQVEDASGTPLLSQLVDNDGDEQPDQLIFQADFGPKESKTFLLGQAPRSAPSHDEYKVYGRFVRERHDDFAWENDRTAHRAYGPELETWPKEPLVSSGIDVWVKRTHRLVVNEWYQSDDYHRDNGDGADFYSVGPSRGCGGLGIWDGKRLYVSRNFTRSRVLANGPIRLIFELSYAPWSIGGGAQISETKRVIVDAGQHFDRFESSLSFKGTPAGLSLAVGVAKHPGAVIETDEARGILRSWEPFAGDNGHLGCAVLATSGSAAGFAETATDHLLLLPLPSAGATASYLVGTGWDKGGDISDSSAWAASASGRASTVRAPVVVSFAATSPRP
jgi:Domain of unknown function (DUF4861)